MNIIKTTNTTYEISMDEIAELIKNKYPEMTDEYTMSDSSEVYSPYGYKKLNGVIFRNTVTSRS